VGEGGACPLIHWKTLSALPLHPSTPPQVAGLLTELTWATGAFIPIAPLLLDVLTAPLLARKPAPSPLDAPVNLPLMVKAGTTALGGKALQDAIVAKTLDLLLDGLRAHWVSPALPELAVAPAAALRAFAKSTRNPQWRARARAIVEALLAQVGVGWGWLGS
jgi:nucleolar complex protein 2